MLNNSSKQIQKVNGTVRAAQPLVCNDMRLTDWFIQDCAKGWLFLVATFPLGQEPLISGFGSTKEQAWQISINNKSFDGELCTRTSDTYPTWKTESGQIINIGHIYSPKGQQI